MRTCRGSRSGGGRQNNNDERQTLNDSIYLDKFNDADRLDRPRTETTLSTSSTKQIEKIGSAACGLSRDQQPALRQQVTQQARLLAAVQSRFGPGCTAYLPSGKSTVTVSVFSMSS